MTILTINLPVTQDNFFAAIDFAADINSTPDAGSMVSMNNGTITITLPTTEANFFAACDFAGDHGVGMVMSPVAA